MTSFRVWIKLTWQCIGACQIDLFLEWGSKLACLQCWGRKLLGFVWGIEIDLVLVRVPKLTCFLCGGQIYLVFVWESKITCFQCEHGNYLFSVWAWKLASFWWWLELTWSQCGESNLTWFQCRDEINLVVVWVVEVDLRRNSLVFVWAWKPTCFCEGGPNWPDLSVWNLILIWLRCRDDVDLAAVWVVEVDLVIERRAKITCFLCKHANLLVFCMVVPNDLISAWGIKLDLIPVSVGRHGFGCCVGCRKWLHFSVVDRHCFRFRIEVDHDLFLASGLKLTGFLCRGMEIDLMIE